MKVSLAFLVFGSFLLCLIKDASANQHRNFGIFNIIQFPNDACESTNGKNGTCYTEEECENKGGTASGSCAEGYGVCCTFAMSCGGLGAENLTYFESRYNSKSGPCNAKICKCSRDVCQLRLDFLSFSINGPSMDTIYKYHIQMGSSSDGGGFRVTTVGLCDTDSFTATSSGGRPSPVICGTNTGYHVFLDALDGCNQLSFHLSDGPSVSRLWNIKITQYTCGSLNSAPPGCLQYFYGSTSGYLESFNKVNNVHLAYQNQLMCIRREESMCQICYSHGQNDFSTSAAVPTLLDGYRGDGSFCGIYKRTYNSGFDFVIIPNPTTKTNGNNVAGGNGHFCGGALVKSMSAGGTDDIATICSKVTPFQMRFITDGIEGGIELNDAGGVDAGFKVFYEQLSC